MTHRYFTDAAEKAIESVQPQWIYPSGDGYSVEISGEKPGWHARTSRQRGLPLAEVNPDPSIPLCVKKNIALALNSVLLADQAKAQKAAKERDEVKKATSLPEPDGDTKEKECTN